MPTVWIGLGSNLGDREDNLRLAFQRLGELLSDFRASRIVESAPMYFDAQPEFLNAAAVGFTKLGPMPLLRALKAIEQKVGRTETFRNGPRVLDLDLLAYGCLQYRFSEGGRVRLEVPHPRMAERAFVLEPLLELVPDGVVPGQGRLQSLADRLRSAPFLDD